MSEEIMTRRSIFAGSSIASVALEAEIDDSYHRLHSGDILMNTAASNAEGYGNRTAHQIAVHPFIEAFDAELNRLANVRTNHKDAIESSAEALLKNADGLLRRRDKMSDTAVSNQLSETRRLATVLENKTIRINVEAMKTEKELRRIAFLADTKLGTVCVDQAERQFSKEPWVDKVSTGHVVKILSDIFSFIRDIEDKGKDKGAEEWKAPASFERVTTKYWVKDEALPEVLLKSACELPILVYGRSGILTENPKDPSEGKGEFWKTMASPISSVYFDSDSMDLYKERIKRSEGAQLFRVRWYGNKPRNDEVIYLELKTHHECWINNKSVKERVGIVQRNMLTLMDTSDGQWTSDFARTLVVEASPDDNEAEIEASTALLLEIRALFCRLKLRPCVRTSYTRAAFQSSKNNDLRLTIDRDITVVDETSVRNEGSWCIEDNDNVPIQSFLKVPYSVFEVKVSGGFGPIFLEQLQESNAIVEAPKFSKFLTGASLHNANKVNILPWWAEDPLFEPIFKMRQKSTRFSKKIESSKALNADMLASSTSTVGGTSTSKGSLRHSSNSFDLAAAEEGRGTNGSARGDNTKKGGLFGLIGMRSRRHAKTDHSKPTAAPRSPARVEPKSFFANERTFIQWVTVGSMFMIVAALIYTQAIFVGPYGGGLALMRLGNALIGCGLMTAIYGIATYYRRLNLMVNAKPYGYADSVGPAVLATFMVALLGSFVYAYYLQFPYPHAPLRAEPGVCVKRNLGLGKNGAFSTLQFEPSSIRIDHEKNLMIVSSLDAIVAYPSDFPIDDATINAPMQVLYQFPVGSEDLEGMAIINGIIYAISEGKKDSTGKDQSDIIALEWSSSGENILEETNRWRIDSGMVEGVAFISDKEWFSSPTLIVSTDERTLDPRDRLSLDAFDFPLPASGTSPTERHLNNKFFVKRLVDSKVGEMQFFKGNLYLLFDNSQVIRAFAPDGTMVNEWVLPVGVPEFDMKWEGMYLDQDGDELHLHLSLDSPPEVWSIKLGGDTAPNSKKAEWSLPRCAGG